MKKYFAAMTSTTLVLALSLIIGLLIKDPASARTLSITAAAAAATAQQGLALPRTNIYALTSDNMLYVLSPGRSSFNRVGRIPRNNGNLIGIDFRVSNNSLYAYTDTGNLLLINLNTSPVSATLVSTSTARFAGGVQSLLDFNPVVNAIRLIGSNDNNFAITSSGGDLNNTVAQTPVAYTTGDTNAGVNPNLCGGSYTNNFVGATTTIFYAIDYDLDTFVTIANVVNGSSATGGGQLQTIGSVVDTNNNPLNFNPVADFDIYTDANRRNTLVGINNQTLFTIDLNQLSPTLAVGTTQRVTARTLNVSANPSVDAFIDIALQPLANNAAPTPTPTAAPTATPAPAATPAPTPSVSSFQAENATLNGPKVVTNVAGATGTGAVSFPFAIGSFVEFTVTQTGTRTLTLRYANTSGLAQSAVLTVNGGNAKTINFPVTGGNFTTFSTSANLGNNPGAKVRLTAISRAGGPTLDRLDVQ